MFFSFFSVFLFPAIPFRKGKPNNHPNKFQTTETNLLEKGNSEIDFEQSTLEK